MQGMKLGQLIDQQSSAVTGTGHWAWVVPLLNVKEKERVNWNQQNFSSLHWDRNRDFPGLAQNEVASSSHICVDLFCTLSIALFKSK